MALFLVQHGKSSPKALDPDQGLSKEGIAEVEHIAAVAKGYGVQVSQIRHSGKTRAHQTADIFGSALTPQDGVRQSAGLNTTDHVEEVAASIDPIYNLMLVGHLPFMERLTSYLITGSIDRPVFIFQNGGIVCLDKHPGSHLWAIKWALMPTIS